MWQPGLYVHWARTAHAVHEGLTCKRGRFAALSSRIERLARR
ncbi:MAG TPA: hypothetical protein PLL33_13570 [Paracoccus sp. (in: a-proteobacteria)]|nr:hypothetical protein [Paracoccus sp. (in: a-proteobacteria)]